MKISGITDGKSRILLLNTGGQAPNPMELGLFLCRSITLLGDYYLAGPVENGTFLCFTQEGLPREPEPFLIAACSDLLHGISSRWHLMELPELPELLACREKELPGFG